MKLKHLLVLLLLFASVLMLSACGDEDTAPPAPTNTPIPISSGKGFIINLVTTEDATKYEYTVTANDGTVIESASCLRQPKVKPLSPSLIGIRFYDDTGTRTWCRYYDIEKGIASRSYFSAFWDNGVVVAYNDFSNSGKLIVRDIFDDSGYYCEALIESNAMELIVTAAVPSEDGKTLTVEYLLGKSASAQTVGLPLVQTP